MPEPEVIYPALWTPGSGLDPAAYLVDPGSVKGPGRHSAGKLAHARPYFVNGNKIFVFPVGTEGFTRDGQATLALHHYLGANTVNGVAIHFEEGRITLSGTFPGVTARDAMIECKNILTMPTSKPSLVLYAPGVFEREQYVLAENWSFSHTEDDRTHSIGYTITVVKIGEGGNVLDIPGNPPLPNPSNNKVKPRGKPGRIYTVSASVRTLRGIAKAVYGNQSLWTKIVQLNQGQMNNWRHHNLQITTYKIPTYRWPIGTKFRY